MVIYNLATDSVLKQSSKNEIACLLWNKKIHHHVPLRSLPPYSNHIKSISILSFHLLLAHSSGLFSHKMLYEFLIAPMYATWPTHLILPDLVTPTMFGWEYKFCSSSLRNSSTLLLFSRSQVQIFSSAPCSQTARVYVPSTGQLVGHAQ
jgi:hypothetical protein